MGNTEARELAAKLDQLRAEKRYTEADEIRDTLIRNNYRVTTTESGTKVRWIPKEFQILRDKNLESLTKEKK